MTSDLRGLVVAVTGGARGIGLATARALTALGAKVAIGDIDESVAKDAATEHDLALAAPLDVTVADSFARFLDRVEAELGPLDVLINNAGIMPLGPVLAEPDEIARRIVEINVFGVLTGTKLAASRMRPRGRGHVINIASLAGEVPVPGSATYSATKHAVLGFTDSTRLELRGSGLSFSSILPWFTNTELVAGTNGVRGVRNVEPAEVAAAVVATIRRPKPRVRVARVHGALVQSQRFLPRAVAEWIGRRLGSDAVFLSDVDAEARKAYEQRARRTG